MSDSNGGPGREVCGVGPAHCKGGPEVCGVGPAHCNGGPETRVQYSAAWEKKTLAREHEPVASPVLGS